MNTRLLLTSIKRLAPVELSDLPDELLVKILQSLQIPALKQARLTCRRWSRVGAHSLFHRIYFAPRRKFMEIFNTVTADPVFATNITEIGT